MYGEVIWGKMECRFSCYSRIFESFVCGVFVI